MKGQKQSRVDNLEKRIAAITRILQELINDVNNTKTIALGVHQTIKEMPDYGEAISKLKEKAVEESSSEPALKAD
jgi:archaellum component FlaC